MNLIQIKEVTLQTADAYILKIFKNLIVTNDEQGLCVYDLDFNFLKRILWPMDVGVYMTYQHFLENKLLLDCLEDGVLLYVDLDNDKIVEIPMLYDPADPCFLGFLYNWFDDLIIFKSSAGYMGVDLKEKMLKPMNDSIVREHLYFYQFCKKADAFFGRRDMPGPFQFVYLVKDENKIGYYNHLSNEDYVISNDVVIDHAIAYSNKNFAFVNAREFRVVSVDGSGCVIQGKKHQEFLIAQFQDGGEYLIVLNFQFVAGKRNEFLTKYRIIKGR